ncbi:MAG: hypothetical protein ABR936_09945 [Bacteroidota bacterium]|jgi:hypothetical protein
MRSYSLILFSILISILISGCATVFSGYTAEVEIHNAPKNLSVYIADGVELPSPYYKTKTVSVHVKNLIYDDIEKVDSTSLYVQVRSNRDYVLLLKVDSTEYRYPVYAKLSGWWFALDLICGGVPMIVDALTGNWNYYDAIYIKK